MRDQGLLFILCNFVLAVAQGVPEQLQILLSDIPTENANILAPRGDEWYRSRKTDDLELPVDPCVRHIKILTLPPDVVGTGFTISDIVSSSSPYIIYVLKRRATIIEGAGSFSDFDLDGLYTRSGEGPIEEDCIIKYHLKEQRIISSFGANIFYHPTSMTIEFDGSIWVADTGLRQVLKFRDGSSYPIQCIGSGFTTNNGRDEFCGPMTVSVTRRHIYVADGLCKSRVVMLDKGGYYISMFNITEDPMDSQGRPIDIAVDLHKDKLYVTKNMLNGDFTRLLIVNAGMRDVTKLGQEIASINPSGIESFQSLALHPTRSKLFTINEYNRYGSYHRGFTFNSQTLALKGHWIQSSNNPNDKKGLYHPLAMALSKNGRYIYVVDKKSPDHTISIFKNEGIIQRLARLRTYNGRSARKRIRQIFYQWRKPDSQYF